MYEISVQVDAVYAPRLSDDWLAEVAQAALASEGVAEAQLGIVITNDETVRDLNRRFAGENETTDVLSFSLREGEAFTALPGEPEPLGEVIIAFPVAERQAQQAGHPLEREVAHLLVHGVLHLLGYDHAEPDEERLMRGKEQALLAAIRLP
ncbi:MAG TPA: rRNA maturation RNase YbeY [Dehalococcoidia bacterium]|nr:rRNA maturation RNase YbeY [Dehalococcoidia bacterium]